MTTNSSEEAAPEATAAVPTDAELARSLAGDFRSEYLIVNSLRLHYVAGGEGRPLLLLPGWPQTWWEYRKVMPALAAAGRRVIALDLPGMGGSDKPSGGYDKKTMADVVHAFVQALGYQQVDIAGHDVGSQVAFSFAANHPHAVRRIAMLDILHPDASLSPAPGLPLVPWWFAFNQVAGLLEQLLAGRAHHLVNWVFDTFLLHQDAVTALDRAVYTRAYNTPDGIRGGNGWHQAIGQDIADLGTYDKLTVPVLGLVSDLADGRFAAQMRATLPGQAIEVEVVVVPDAGHYFVEEAPQVVIEQLDRFFD
ncbi:alpha/beta fold hydrolase [Kitasatospora sp. Root107]|uniref:alpha/beta fold hydrolase n=1 Tax=Kitasatospora sp. Root107 TaxID=1736424 RepID=UPI00070FFE16|nr:alpha/beta hydrolase [Kitasatospora sp. Root107]KQV13770.1 alpha/beta hydrolase [Kitasatospora sp. Root107]